MPVSEEVRALPDLVSFPPEEVSKNSERHYPAPHGGIRTISAPSGGDDVEGSISKTGGAHLNANDGIQALEIKAGLEPYSGTLDATTARHLLRRTGFGAAQSQLNSLVGTLATGAVDAIVDAAINNPHPDTPTWVSTPIPGPNATEEEWMLYNDWTFATLDQFRTDWLKMMASEGLRERLTMFWQDHFATTQDKYYHVQIAQRYIELLRTHSIGNFRQFVSDIGLNSAMLIFLDGVENRKDAPNENYARELCELFTMGITDKNGLPNYTEHDIKEIARGLTGYVVDLNLDTLFFNVIHDGDEKEIFGQTGNWGYNDVIDIVFAQREQETAWYICKKLYQEFVYEAEDPAIVQELADLFIASNWELAPVIRTLLKSAHFFDSQVIGSRIASPTEMLIRYTNELADGRAEDGHYLVAQWASWGLEQVLTLVPSVNGWPRHRNWISTTTMPERWAVCGWMIWIDQDPVSARLDIQPTLRDLEDFQDPHVVFRIGASIVRHLFSVPIEELDIEELSVGFAGDLTTHPLPDFVVNGPAYERNLAMLLLEGIPWYEFNPNASDDWVFRRFIAQLAQMPEFQLT